MKTALLATVVVVGLVGGGMQAHADLTVEPQKPIVVVKGGQKTIEAPKPASQAEVNALEFAREKVNLLRRIYRLKTSLHKKAKQTAAYKVALEGIGAEAAKLREELKDMRGAHDAVLLAHNKLQANISAGESKHAAMIADMQGKLRRTQLAGVGIFAVGAIAFAGLLAAKRRKAERGDMEAKDSKEQYTHKLEQGLETVSRFERMYNRTAAKIQDERIAHGKEMFELAGVFRAMLEKAMTDAAAGGHVIDRKELSERYGGKLRNGLRWFVDMTVPLDRRLPGMNRLPPEVRSDRRGRRYCDDLEEIEITVDADGGLIGNQAAEPS